MDLFKSVQSVLKLDNVKIDNNVCRLNYKMTCVMLLVCSLLVTSKQYIGDPIDCSMDGATDKQGKLFDTFCWIQTTFTVPHAYGLEVGKEVPHPGVGPVKHDEEVKYHKYYQWVCFFLFFSAVLFYAPRYLWKNWENGRVKHLTEGCVPPVMFEPAELRTRTVLLATYLYRNKGHNKSYAFRFFFCELLNFVNVVGIIFLTDVFLDYEFTNYGANIFDAIIRPEADRIDPMSYVFPKVTKCTFHSYGPSGSMVKKDGICVLSLNIVNEKIFVLLYFWYMCLAVINGLAVIYRLITVLSWSVRSYIFKASNSIALTRDLNTVLYESDVGDWFLYRQLSFNMDPLAFNEMIVDLAGFLRTGIPVE